MFGIIKKDFYDSFCVPKNLANNVIGLGVIWILALLMGPGEYMMLLLVVVTLPMMSVSVLQYSMEQDELAKFDEILLTYPLSKREIILAKFIDNFLFTVGVSVISFLLMLWYVVGCGVTNMKTGFLYWMAGNVVALFIAAVSFIVFYWLGNKIGTVIYMIMVGVAAFSYVITYLNVPVEKIVALGSWKLLGIGFVISVLALIGSYWGCLKIYTKRHS